MGNKATLRHVHKMLRMFRIRVGSIYLVGELRFRLIHLAHMNRLQFHTGQYNEPYAVKIYDVESDNISINVTYQTGTLSHFLGAIMYVQGAAINVEIARRFLTETGQRCGGVEGN